MPSLLSAKKSASKLYSVGLNRYKSLFDSGNLTLRLWCAAYLLVLSLAFILIKNQLIEHAAVLRAGLLPEYQETVLRPNFHLVELVAIICAGSGCLALYWLRAHLPSLKKIAAPLSVAIIILALSGTILSYPHLPDWIFLIALVLAYKGGSLNSRFFVAAPAGALSRLLLLLPPLAAIIFVMCKSWLPIFVPQDYYEIAGRIKTSALVESPQAGDPDTLSRAEAVACAEEYNAAHAAKPDTPTGSPAKRAAPPVAAAPVKCPLAKPYDILLTGNSALQTSGGWQTQVGRMLYHHAYLFVPAHHIEKYGMTGDVPVLYGALHTGLYALLMKEFGDGIGDYFHYYFALIFVGILLIACTVYAITRSWYGFASALTLSFAYFFMVGFVASYFALSFAPLRLFGLLLQTGSIFILLRRSDALGVVLLWLALVISLGWNTEYAAIGFAGQVLALLAPGFRVRSLPSRLAILAGFTGTLLLLLSLKFSSGMLLNNISITFYGLHKPTPVSSWEFNKMILYIAAASLLAGYGASHYPGGARDARLCIIPILALLLVKYCMEISPPHFYITMTFIAPLLLVYYPGWQGSGDGIIRQRLKIDGKLLIYLLCAIFCVSKSIGYIKESRDFRKDFITPFITSRWDSDTLHDSLLTVIPQEPIAKRVDTIRAEMRGDDTLLILSPFDHLLSFYTEPRRFCGHFELLTNLIMQSNTTLVEQCVLDSPNSLVVYDKALLTPCPDTPDYVDKPACDSKFLMKQTLTGIRNDLLPNLTPVKETDELILYRIKPLTGTKDSLH